MPSAGAPVEGVAKASEKVCKLVSAAFSESLGSTAQAGLLNEEAAWWV
jgi:hypothetical protein